MVRAPGPYSAGSALNVLFKKVGHDVHRGAPHSGTGLAQ